jgi:hypothetical protein
MPCSDIVRNRVFQAQAGRCWLCGLTAKEHPHCTSLAAHRIIPGRAGGEYVYGNVVLVGPECHRIVEGLNMSQILTLFQPYGEEVSKTVVSETSRNWTI